MPTLKDIERFKSSLLALGREQETLALWGEALEEPPPPQPSSAQPEALDTAEAPPPVLESEEEAAAVDFSSFLDQLPIDALPGDEAPEEATPSFDIPDFGIPETGTPEQEPGALDTDFLAQDALLSGLGEELASAEGDQEKIEEAIPDFSEEEPGQLEEEEANEAEGYEPAAAPEAPDISDFAIPDFPDFDEAPGGTPLELEDGEPAPEELEAEPELSAEPMAEDFAIPEFSLAQEGEAVPGPSPSEGPPPEEQGFDLASESPEGDSFEQFDLGGESMGDFGSTSLPDLGMDDFAPKKDDIDGQLASLESELPPADTFSLDGGWGADFSIPGFEMGTESPAKKSEKTPSRAAIASMEAAFGNAQPKAAKAAKSVDLDDAQVDALQDSLLSYPLNLRLAVEDIIANNKGTEEQQAELIWMLVERARAKDAAKAAGKILKRYIEIPAGFEKRTGAAFEAEKGSFAYVFVHSILPMLQAVVLAAIAGGILYFLGYNFAYRPIKAHSLYAEGDRQIKQRLYKDSESMFDQADKLWSMKSWHYRYARSYADEAQYPRSEAMYERLLRRWPRETQAALLYARMESVELQAYEKAETILTRHVLEREYFNRDALLLSADNFLAWADYEEQRYEGPDRTMLQGLYESARRRLALIMEKHGRSDAYLERMLLYFIRVDRAGASDKSDDVEALAKYFTENKKSAFSSATLAESADYLLSKDRLDYVNGLLMAAVDRDGTHPESYATLAKLNRRTGFPEEERKALDYAARFFKEADNTGASSQRRVRSYLGSLIRLAEMKIASRENLSAEETLDEAIGRYERALSERVLRREAEFGKAYSLFADLHFLERRDFPGALTLYQEAEDHGYITPEGDYRRGYMHYYAGTPDAERALVYFHRAGLSKEPTPYLTWAIANSMYERGNYFAAQGYFSMLVERMQFALATLSLVEPQSRPSHGEIVELLMMAQNNLGVSLHRVADRTGDPGKRAAAMVAFMESSRLYDALSRDQKSMIKSESKNLGFLNVDFILHPSRGIDLATYRQLPLDMAYPRK